MHRPGHNTILCHSKNSDANLNRKIGKWSIYFMLLSMDPTDSVKPLKVYSQLSRSGFHLTKTTPPCYYDTIHAVQK